METLVLADLLHEGRWRSRSRLSEVDGDRCFDPVRHIFKLDKATPNGLRKPNFFKEIEMFDTDLFTPEIRDLGSRHPNWPQSRNQ